MGTSSISPPRKQLKKVLSALKDLFAGLAPYKALPRVWLGHIPSPLWTSVSSSVKWCPFLLIHKVMRRRNGNERSAYSMLKHMEVTQNTGYASYEVRHYTLQSCCHAFFPFPFKLPIGWAPMLCQARCWGLGHDSQWGIVPATSSLQRTPHRWGMRWGLDKLAGDRADVWVFSLRLLHLLPSRSRGQTSIPQGRTFLNPEDQEDLLITRRTKVVDITGPCSALAFGCYKWELF